MRYRRGGLQCAKVGGKGIDRKNLELRGLSEENKYSRLAVLKVIRRKSFNYAKRV